jgi:hypothetical protein
MLKVHSQSKILECRKESIDFTINSRNKIVNRVTLFPIKMEIPIKMYPFLLFPFTNVIETIIPLCVAFVIGTSIFAFVKLYHRPHGSSFFTKKLMGAYLFNIIFQSLGITCRYATKSTLQYFIVATMVPLCVYIVCILETQVLEIFAVLDVRITPRLIKGLQIGITILLIVFCLPHVSRLFITPPGFASSLVVIFGFIAVIFDNTVVISLFYLVYSSKKHHISLPVLKKFTKAVWILIVIVVFDWSSLSFFAYSFLVVKPDHTSQLYNVTEAVSFITPGIHLTTIFFVFEQLKGITFSGSKDKGKAVQPKNTLAENVKTKIALVSI